MTDQKERVREAYNELAETHFEERSDAPAEASLLDEIRSRVGSGSRVLDAGCGQGTPVASGLTPAHDVVGLDFSAEQLALAADVVPRADLVRGDMTSLGFRADAFDAVCAYHSIIHVPVPEHRTVIDEFARVLGPDGLLLLSSGGTDWTGSNPDWLDSGVEMHWSYPEPEETRAMLEDAGFEVLDSWIVTDRLGDDGDSEVLDGVDATDAAAEQSSSSPASTSSRQDAEDDVPLGKPFFLAKLR